MSFAQGATGASASFTFINATGSPAAEHGSKRQVARAHAARVIRQRQRARARSGVQILSPISDDNPSKGHYGRPVVSVESSPNTGTSFDSSNSGPEDQQEDIDDVEDCERWYGPRSRSADASQDTFALVASSKVPRCVSPFFGGLASHTFDTGDPGQALEASSYRKSADHRSCYVMLTLSFQC